jgi:hypothetical protein
MSLKPKWERPTNIQVDWFSGLNEEQRLVLNRQLTTNQELFDALRSILERRFDSADIGEYQFDSPAFQERLIFSQGYKKALKDIYRLLPTKE